MSGVELLDDDVYSPGQSRKKKAKMVIFVVVLLLAQSVGCTNWIIFRIIRIRMGLI